MEEEEKEEEEEEEQKKEDKLERRWEKKKKKRSRRRKINYKGGGGKSGRRRRRRRRKIRNKVGRRQGRKKRRINVKKGEKVETFHQLPPSCHISQVPQMQSIGRCSQFSTFCSKILCQSCERYYGSESCSDCVAGNVFGCCFFGVFFPPCSVRCS